MLYEVITFAPRRVDRVVVAIDEKRGKFPVRQLMELRLLGAIGSSSWRRPSATRRSERNNFV